MRIFRVLFDRLKTKMTNHGTVINCERPDAVRVAADLLLRGEVIALPTDTIYGLACMADSPEAIDALYSIKGRSEVKPVAICVSDVAGVKECGRADHVPDELLGELLPGPVTLIFEKTARLNNVSLNPGISKIGIRIPDCKFAIDVAAACGAPFALTSANRSGEASSLRIEEFESLHGRLAAVFDGGTIDGNDDAGRAGSTVVDLSRPGYFEIIREGVAFRQTIAKLRGFQPKSVDDN